MGRQAIWTASGRCGFPAGSYNILFSFIGYETKSIRFTGKNLADFARITLQQEAVEMDDVVVTGIYRRKKESFTGSSTTFKAEELKSVGTANVLQSLRTLDPSFKIMETTGSVPTPTACRTSKSGARAA